MSRYTVKQVAALTGVPPATLRAWERRYAVVEPERTSSQYRLYGEDDVARLTRMARLVAAGAPASLAAQEVAGSAVEPPAEPATTARPERPDASQLIAAAESFDPALLDRVLDEAFALGTFEHVIDGWLMPALGELGMAWSEGRIDEAGEHFVSGAVHRRLAQSFEAAGARVGAPVVVVGLPPGSLHQLGVLSFATALRRSSVDVRYIGADVPVAGWRRTVTQLRPAAAVVGVPMPSDAPSGVEAVRALDGTTRVLVGGSGAADVAEATGAELLPGSLVEAARALSDVLHAGGTGPLQRASA